MKGRFLPGGCLICWVMVKRSKVKIAKQLLKIFPKYHEKKFANVVTGNETWIHYFESVRKVSNKIWATKVSKRPVIAKHMLSTKKVLYAIFSGESVPIQVPVKKGKSVTGKYFKDVVLKKLKKYYQPCPVMGFKHVWHLHDNAPAQTSAIVTNFLQKKLINFTTPSLFTRPCPLWLLPFSEIENLPCWTYILVQTGTWICRQYLTSTCIPKSECPDAIRKWNWWLKLWVSRHGE